MDTRAPTFWHVSKKSNIEAIGIGDASTKSKCKWSSHPRDTQEAMANRTDMTLNAEVKPTRRRINLVDVGTKARMCLAPQQQELC